MLRIILLFVLAVGCYICYGLATRPATRNPGRAWMAAALILTGVNAFTWELYDQLTAWTGIPNVARLIGHIVGGVAAACAAQSMVAYWAYPADQARRATRRQIITSTVIATAMIGLFLTTPTEQERGEWQDRYANIPQIAVYVALFNLAIGWMLYDLRRSSWHYAHRIHDRPRIQMSLRLFAIGAGIGLLYPFTHVINTVATLLGHPLPQPAFDLLVRTGQYLCLLFVAAAAVVPGIGAATTRSRRAILTARLRPLWSAIRDVFPSPRGDEGPRNTAQAIISGLTARDDYPVNRMVIDIRDGYLEMRPWIDAGVMNRARRHAQQADLSGDTLDATVEAATVACALRDKQAGRRPTNTGEVEGGAADMAGEARWLARVSQAIRSRVVQVVVEQTTPAQSWVDEQLGALGINRTRQ
ncbi:MAB_1171c family putative transporter [Micromonospora sp. NPDC006766]|uniref:MAB_1171c family putative transporter n=1 Tax=Micromonospora sp. NPDC006766 TaxID=3154778 RepID=UPI0033EA11D0